MANNLGSDFYELFNLDPSMPVVTGIECVAQNVVRRLTTKAGSLPWDPTYGEDIGDLLGRTGFSPRIAENKIEQQCLLDERVEEATVTIVQSTNGERVTINVKCQTAIGPFSLTLAVADLTVSILKETFLLTADV
jgi:hypothetical protein